MQRPWIWIVLLIVLASTYLVVQWVTSAQSEASHAAPDRTGAPALPAGPATDRRDVAPLSTEPESDATAAARDPAQEESFDPFRPLRIVGRVVLDGSGAPVAGAEIELAYSEGGVFADATSENDGTFQIEIDGGIPDRFVARALHDDFAPTSETLTTPRGQNELELTLRLHPSFVVRGRVVEGDSQKPVAGADVRLSCSLAAFESDQEDAVSELDGSFAFEDVTTLPPRDLVLVASTEGMSAGLARGLRVESGARELVVELTLGRDLRVVGQAVDARTGEPLPDAVATLSTGVHELQDGGDQSATGADGRFEMGLGGLADQGLYLHVTSKGHMARVVERFERKGDVLDAGAIALEPSVTLHGIVLAKGSRDAISAGDVVVRRAGVATHLAQEHEENTLIEPDGTFQVALESVGGPQIAISVEAPGFVAQERELDLGALTSGSPQIFELDLALLVRGTLSRAKDGRPIKGARVFVLGGAGAPPTAVTDKQGFYELEVPQAESARLALVVEVLGLRRTFGPLGVVEGPERVLRRDLEFEIGPVRDLRPLPTDTQLPPGARRE